MKIIVYDKVPRKLKKRVKVLIYKRLSSSLIFINKTIVAHDINRNGFTVLDLNNGVTKKQIKDTIEVYKM